MIKLSKLSIPFFLIMLVGLVSNASAQLELAPTRVLLSSRQRTQEVTVRNTTGKPMEVSTDLSFKLIRADEDGSLSLDSAKTDLERARSGRDWVKIFPRRFTLAPGASRLIRVMVTIPDSVADGEYWARMVVAGMPLGSSVPVMSDSTEGFATDLTMRLEMDIPVMIRKGPVSTGIEVVNAEARATQSGSLFLLDLRRNGNSAYRGTLTLTVQRADGTVAATREAQYTTEFDLRTAIRLPKLTDGVYDVSVTSKSVKKGSANDAVIPAPDMSRSYHLAVAGEHLTLTP